MAEKIYIRNAGGDLEPLAEERFETEDLLQELIGQHPELLAGEQMRPGDPLRWILIKREMPIEGWAVDHLLIDQDARPTLVEVKRGDNPDVRRKVVGQMLDYAANAACVWTERDMRRIFEESQDDPNDAISALLGDDGEPDIDGFWERVATNLAANRLRLLFVADEIPTHLERVVKFLNENTRDNLEVFAVEVKQYPGQSTQTLVSRVIGEVATPRSSSAGTTRQRLTREEFLAQFSEEVSAAIASLLAAAECSGASFVWATSSVRIDSHCPLIGKPVTLARLWLPLPDYIRGNWTFIFYKNSNDQYPPTLLAVLDRWVGKFEQDDFVSAPPNSSEVGAAIHPEVFAKHVDLLSSRLCDTIAEISDL